MLVWWLSVAFAGPVALDRVELLADDPGSFLVDDVPLVLARPGVVSLRALGQVQPVARVGERGLTVGLSLSSLSVGWESTPDARGFGALVAIPTRLGLPVGAVVGGVYRRGPLWVDVGLAARTDATWARPAFSPVRVGPTVGVGWVPKGRRSD